MVTKLIVTFLATKFIINSTWCTVFVSVTISIIAFRFCVLAQAHLHVPPLCTFFSRASHFSTLATAPSVFTLSSSNNHKRFVRGAGGLATGSFETETPSEPKQGARVSELLHERDD